MKSLFALALAVCTAVSIPNTLQAQDSPPAWTDFTEHNEIAYLLRKSPAQIMRYDLSARDWLAPLSLDTIPSAFAIEGTDLYVASTRSIKRFDLSGENETHVANTSENIIQLLIDGNFLFANQNKSLYLRMSSFDRTTNTLIEYYEDYVAGVAGGDIAPSLNRIFGRSQGYGPSDINYVEYTDSATFSKSGESPYHGDYPGAQRVWVFPDENKVVDDSGTVYNTSDLTYNNSFGVQIDALTFHGNDVPIALIGDTLFAYTNTLLETGSKQLTVTNPRDILVHGEDVIVFYQDPNLTTKVGAISVPLADLSTSDPGEAISPVGLDFDVDDSVVDADGILYLLNKTHSSLFRWDTIQQKYIDTIPLPVPCDKMVYAPGPNRIYLYSTPRKLYQVDLDDDAPQAVHFANLPNAINKMIPLGNDLFALSNGGWDDQWLFGEDGALLASNVSCCYEDYHFYDAAKKRLYYDSVYVEYLGEGKFSEPVSNGYSEDEPLALSPDGSKIIGMNGLVYNAETREQIDTLSNDVKAAVWDAQGTLFTVEKYPYNSSQTTDNTTNVQKWNEYYAAVKEVDLDGEYVLLANAKGNLLIVTQLNGAPSISLFDSDFQIVAPETLEAPILEVASYSATAASLEWNDVFGEQSYTIERKLAAGAWQVVGSTEFGKTYFVDLELEAGNLYQFRAKAVNGAKESAYSNSVTVDLVGTVDERVDPTQIYFTPDFAALSKDDVLYLHSREHDSIFAWNARTCKWISTIPLNGDPVAIAYSKENNALYTAYSDGRIFSIGSAASNPIEIPFADLGELTVNGVAAAGNYVVVSDANGYLSSYDASGKKLSSKYFYYKMLTGVWDAAQRRVFFFRNGYSNDRLYTIEVLENGEIGELKDGPQDNSSNPKASIRIHPNGSLLLGSGRIYDGSTFSLIDNLPESHVDATWIDSRLYTFSDTKITAWKLDSYSVYLTRSVSETPAHLFATQENQLLAVSTANGQTFIDLLDTSLEPIAKSAPPAAEGLRAIPEGDSGFAIAWSDVPGETGYRLERSTDGSTWTAIATNDPNKTSATDSTAESGASYTYRVVTLFGDTDTHSESFALSLTVPPTPDAPNVTAPDYGTLKVSWSAVDNAISYLIERSENQQNWHTIQPLYTDGTSYNDLYLAEGTQYFYRVTSRGLAGNSDPSPIGSAFTKIDPPNSVPSVSATPNGSFAVDLSWSSVYKATFYHLERSISGGNWTTLDDALTATQYTDKTVQPDTSYRYRVTAYNSGGNATPTSSATINSPSLTIPISPTHRSAQSDTKEVLITWAPVTNAQNYKIYRRTDSNDSWLIIGTVSSEDLPNFHDDTVNLGQSFEYSVSAVNSLGESDKSTPTSITIYNITPIIALDFSTMSHLEELSYTTGNLAENQDAGSGKYLLFNYGTRLTRFKSANVEHGGIISIDLKTYSNRNSNVSTPVNFSYWDFSETKWTVFATIEANEISLSEWRTFQIDIPVEIASAALHLQITQEGSSYSFLGVDNLILYATIPEKPASAAFAFTQTNPDGGLAVFWLPSQRSKTYQIKRSSNGGLTWADLAEVESPQTHYIDESAKADETYSYQVIAQNSGGSSPPASTIGSEVNNQITTAYAAGKAEVLENLSAYDLHPSDTVTHVYMKFAEEAIRIDGNIIKLPWILYSSADLISWSKQRIDLAAFLSNEESAPPQFFKLGFESPAK